MKVRIAIPTFHRPEGLSEALAAVLEQVASLDPAFAQASVMVVDNDPEGSARSICEAAGVLYVVEPHPGIAAVRNRALDEAVDQDAIVFIDDDEVPLPGWLETLLRRLVQSGAQGVAGKVLTHFPDGVSEWVTHSGAFRRPERVDGVVMPEAATNNLVLDLHAVRRSALRFDERFGLSGGSDSLFTRSFTRWGARIVWAEEAVVVEREDPGRLNRAWVLQRAFRIGNTTSRVTLDLARPGAERAFVRIRMIGAGALRVVTGASRAVMGRVTGSMAHRGRGERQAARGRGMVAGALGHVYGEYALRRAAMETGDASAGQGPVTSSRD